MRQVKLKDGQFEGVDVDRVLRFIRNPYQGIQIKSGNKRILRKHGKFLFVYNRTSRSNGPFRYQLDEVELDIMAQLLLE